MCELCSSGAGRLAVAKGAGSRLPLAGSLAGSRLPFLLGHREKWRALIDIRPYALVTPAAVLLIFRQVTHAFYC